MEGVGMDPEKIQGVFDWEIPKTRKTVAKFPGFTNFYRAFIPNFSKVALPLTDLLKGKGKPAKLPGVALDWSPAWCSG